MSQIALWLGGLLSVVYGALNALAGYGQTQTGKIQPWAAWSFVAFGLFVSVAGVMTFLRSISAIWLLTVGLLGIHALAIDNGRKMYGKINLSHHLARLAVSIILLGLTYFGLK